MHGMQITRPGTQHHETVKPALTILARRVGLAGRNNAGCGAARSLRLVPEACMIWRVPKDPWVEFLQGRNLGIRRRAADLQTIRGGSRKFADQTARKSARR
jgi:hypothetical protein